MIYSQKYCLVHFIEPISIGDVFQMADWPLHITLADVFAIDRTANNIDTKLKELLSTQPPVTVIAMQEAVLGTAEVVLLRNDKSILNLHEGIVRLLKANSATFNTPEFTLSGFLPHSTIQSSGRLHEGDGAIIDSITLIDMFPDEDWQRRKVLNTFKLREGQF